MLATIYSFSILAIWLALICKLNLTMRNKSKKRQKILATSFIQKRCHLKDRMTWKFRSTFGLWFCKFSKRRNAARLNSLQYSYRNYTFTNFCFANLAKKTYMSFIFAVFLRLPETNWVSRSKGLWGNPGTIFRFPPKCNQPRFIPVDFKKGEHDYRPYILSILIPE